MKTIVAAAGLLFVTVSGTSAQQQFNNIEDYCYAVTEGSSATLLAPSQGISKATAEQYMSGMTDPVAIRMTHEVIDFAYSRPKGTKLDQMRAELKSLCINRKILVQ
jgi:hypothetical protein